MSASISLSNDSTELHHQSRAILQNLGLTSAKGWPSSQSNQITVLEDERKEWGADVLPAVVITGKSELIGTCNPVWRHIRQSLCRLRASVDISALVSQHHRKIPHREKPINSSRVNESLYVLELLCHGHKSCLSITWCYSAYLAGSWSAQFSGAVTCQIDPPTREFLPPAPRDSTL